MPQPTADIVSLRGFRARRLYRRYLALPGVLRTPARTRPVLEAIMAYACEDTPRAACAAAENDRLVCQRLQEFLPRDPASSWPGGVMGWLHDNLVPEALQQRDHLAEFLGDCLRGG